MKTLALILSLTWFIAGRSLAQQAAPVADGSNMKAGDISKQWRKTVPPVAPVLRTRGLTRGSSAAPVQVAPLRTRGAGLSQHAMEANADVLESLRNRGMKILKGTDASAAHVAQNQASAATSATLQQVAAATPSPSAFVEVPVVPEKQIAFRLRFQKDSVELADAESQRLVATIAQAMKDVPDVHFLLEGHTCDLGETDYNQHLSELRALRVRTLLGDMGISSSRLLSVGQGETQCEVPNTSEANRALNRRVVIGPIELPRLP